MPSDLMAWYHRQESNLYLRLRRSPFYPLNYGGLGLDCNCRGSGGRRKISLAWSKRTV